METTEFSVIVLSIKVSQSVKETINMLICLIWKEKGSHEHKQIWTGNVR